MYAGEFYCAKACISRKKEAREDVNPCSVTRVSALDTVEFLLRESLSVLAFDTFRLTFMCSDGAAYQSAATILCGRPVGFRSRSSIGSDAQVSIRVMDMMVPQRKGGYVRCF